MKIGEFDGYQIYIPTSGGKAGKGNAISGSIRACKDGRIVFVRRFIWADRESRLRAIRKIKSLIRGGDATMD